MSEYIVEDTDWKAEAIGGPGEEVSLQLMLRVVADVGIVGFPNAGKSSLLAAITRSDCACHYSQLGLPLLHSGNLACAGHNGCILHLPQGNYKLAILLCFCC